jgi:hypothetical protein
MEFLCKYSFWSKLFAHENPGFAFSLDNELHELVLLA